MTRHKGVVIAFGVLLASCGPTPGVLVTREGDKYVIEIKNCATMVKHKLPVVNVQVYKERESDTSDSRCLMVANGEDVELARWVYGTEPAGFNMRSCSPFEHDVIYKVDVITHPGGAFGRFSIDSHGDVKMMYGDCR
jgi:hypothetical protein